MSEKTLEQQQREFDAWRAEQEGEGAAALKYNRSKAKWEPVKKKAGRSEGYAEFFYVSFLKILGYFCFLGVVFVCVTDMPMQLKIWLFLSCLFSGVLWLAMAHALRLLEELHWERKK